MLPGQAEFGLLDPPDYRINLDNLETSTAQEVFDQGAQHILSMSGPCIHPVLGVCSYRDFEGNACPAGCFIHHEQYFPCFEEEGDWRALIFAEDLSPWHEDLISSLQKIHDDSFMFLKKTLDIKDMKEGFLLPDVRPKIIESLKNLASSLNLIYKF